MTEQVEVQEATEEQEAQAFEAGYGEVRGEEPPTETAPEPSKEEPVVEAASQEPERNQFGLTDEETRNLLAMSAKVPELERRLEQSEQKIHGKLGEAFRTLKQLQSDRASNNEKPLTVRQLNNLRDVFPEMADLLEKDLGVVNAPEPKQAAPVQTQVHPVQQETQQVQQPEIDPQEIERQVELARQAAEIKIIDSLVPDWRDLYASKDFHVWKSMLPQEDQIALEGWDGQFIAKAMMGFKGWRESAEKARTQRTNRLEAAITPQGVSPSGGQALDDNAAFAEGWKAVRG